MTEQALMNLDQPVHLCCAKEQSRYATDQVLFTGLHAMATDGRRMVAVPLAGPAGYMPERVARRLFYSSGRPRHEVAGWRRLQDGRIEIEYRNGERWTSSATGDGLQFPPARSALPDPNAEYELVARLNSRMLHELATALAGEDERDRVAIWRKKGSTENVPLIVTGGGRGVGLLMPVSGDSNTGKTNMIADLRRLHEDPGVPGVKKETASV